MQLIIKPDKTSIGLILEAQQYSRLWKQHARKLHRAFRDITGLKFQQRVITARVFDGRQSDSGFYHHPMRLAGDYRSEEFKVATIVHELSHRLLMSNALGVVSLGLLPYKAKPEESNTIIELDHRHLYLFEYDVIVAALGAEWGAICHQYEERESSVKNSPHKRAWKWAMSLSFEQRQQILKWLTAKKLERGQWSDIESITDVIDFETWDKQLMEAAQI